MLFRTLTFTTTFETINYITSPTTKTIAGTVYHPIVCDIDGIELNGEGSSNSLTIKLSTDFDRASLFTKDEVIVKVLQQEYDTETQVFRVLFKGVVKAAQLDVDNLTLECYPTIASPSSSIPAAVYSGYCQHTLYSQGNANKVACGVGRSKHTLESVVVSVDSNTVGVAGVAGFLREGALAITAELLKGAHLTVDGGGSRYVIEVEENAGVWLCRLSGDVLWAVGQVVRITLGCDKSDVQCEGKFDNVVNFFGFKKIPGVNPFANSLRIRMS